VPHFPTLFAPHFPTLFAPHFPTLFAVSRVRLIPLQSHSCVHLMTDERAATGT
jgi:hypothetical protein